MGMVLYWSLILYLSKGIHVGQLQWDSTRKVMTVLKISTGWVPRSGEIPCMNSMEFFLQINHDIKGPLV